MKAESCNLYLAGINPSVTVAVIHSNIGSVFYAFFSLPSTQKDEYDSNSASDETQALSPTNYTSGFLFATTRFSCELQPSSRSYKC
jgi:hypothetical protein